jgi:hypothetical protein
MREMNKGMRDALTELRENVAAIDKNPGTGY